MTFRFGFNKLFSNKYIISAFCFTSFIYGVIHCKLPRHILNNLHRFWNFAKMFYIHQSKFKFSTNLSHQHLILKQIEHFTTQFFLLTLLEPPPLPSTLPPAGGRAKNTRIATIHTANSAFINNVNNNSDESMHSTPWHLKTSDVGSNNNGDSFLSNQMTSSNNFLEEERAASAIATGKSSITRTKSGSGQY